MEEARKMPIPNDVLTPRPPVKKDKQAAGATPTPILEATISRRNSNMGPSVKIEDDDEPKPLIREPISSKQPAPGAVDGPPATVKRKREETPEKKPKKVKAEEELEEEPEKKLAYCIHCEEEFDPEDEDDDGYCPGGDYHPGDMELNRYSHSWRMEACIDPWESGSGSEYDLDTDEWRWSCPGGFTWDCCGESGGSMGCERRDHEAEESDEDDE